MFRVPPHGEEHAFVDDPPQARLIAEPETKQFIEIAEPEILQAPLRLRAQAIKRMV